MGTRPGSERRDVLTKQEPLQSCSDQAARSPRLLAELPEKAQRYALMQVLGCAV